MLSILVEILGHLRVSSRFYTGPFLMWLQAAWYMLAINLSVQVRAVYKNYIYS